MKLITNRPSRTWLYAVASSIVSLGLLVGQAAAQAKALVLYDTTGPYARVSEAHGILAANLCGHFGTVTVKPVAKYTAGEMLSYTGVVYVGSTYDEPLPQAFLSDVLSEARKVVWIYDNIWSLTAADPNFTVKYGWQWKQFEFASVTQVVYKGTSLSRHPLNNAGIMDYWSVNPDTATVLAEAVRGDGTRFPWAIRSRNLTYIGETPFAYMTESDRYLAFADILFDLLKPNAPQRRRAMLRLEDVGPDADPADLRAIADYLYSQKVPYSVGVYTRFMDPYGVWSGGKAVDVLLTKAPAVVAELKYMSQRGGTLLMHGYTHQFEKLINPYNGVSGDDFEFYRAYVDATDTVVLTGPVPGDSTAMVKSRVKSAKDQFSKAKLPQPTIFEFPHYAASVVDYLAIKSLFAARYERSLYFPGLLSGATIDYTMPVGQFFPYKVRDLYGSIVLPENIGNYEPDAYNNHPARFPVDIAANAAKNLVIRDSVASFFYHPYYGLPALQETVTRIKALGFTFVSAQQMLVDP